MILFLEIFTFIILLNFEVLRKIIYNEFSLVASFLALKNTEKCDFFYIYN